MRIRTWSAALIAVALTATSCSENGILNPGKSAPGALRLEGFSGASVVISQVYGGGGNSGSNYKNDFIELHNRGTETVDLTGWSVQYASAAGTSFLVTPLTSRSIAPGQYMLVQEAAGTGGTTALPAPDFTGTIAMSATDAKVALVTNTKPLTCTSNAITCPDSVKATISDIVGYGSGNLFEGSKAAPTLSNTTAAARRDNGCQDTNDNGADFAFDPLPAPRVPAPRNSSTAPVPCGVVIVTGPLDHLVVTGGNTVGVGADITLTVELQDAANHKIDDAAATYDWSSADDATVHLVPTTGKTATLKGVKVGGPVKIAVSATSNAITKNAVPDPTITVTGGPTIIPTTTFVSEIHYDNAGGDVGEAIEIEGDAGSSIDGWRLVLYDGNGGNAYKDTTLAGTIPATCNARGVVVIRFPDTPTGTVQNGSPDGWALVTLQGVTEFRSYEGTFAAVGGPAAGLTSTAIEADESTAPPVGRSVQRAGNGVWFGPGLNTFGACNPPLPIGAQGSVTLTSGKTDLAFAMQTQFFAGGTNLTGQPVTAVVWSTSNPAIISVDQKGIVTGKGVGTAQLVATAPDGASGTVDVSIHIAPGPTGVIRLGHNTEFGEPKDADPSDDFLIRRAQYTVSYNPGRGGANWVSWNLDASHIGDNGRCPGTCYSADTALSNAGLKAYTTADWVSNVNNITGYDRGHMAPSADWTSSEADNNTTFFLTNFLPQRADLNQGPWEVLEEALRDSVKAGTREGYIIAGGIFTHGVGLGTLLDSGRVAIPDSTWKIAVFTPAGSGLNADGTLPANSTVMVVNMPNVQGIRGADWHTYLTTVAKIEQSTGYNFLALIAESVQCRVEQRNCAPVAHITGSNAINEGQSITLSAATSSDPDANDALSLAWTVNGVSAGTGQTLSPTFVQDGSYTVRLIVSDNHGAADTTSTTVNVANVAPAISALGSASLLPGETYSANGSFSDPGADPWSATVNYGEGAGFETLVLNNKSFVLAHTYVVAGTFTVTVRVSDDDATSSRTQVVTVFAPAQALQQASDMLRDLADRSGVSSGNVNSLNSKIDGAQAQLAKGNAGAAANQLQALLNELDAMVRSGRVTAADAAALKSLVSRAIQSISP
jgi:DNA/RNA endonuclease G (NUC1)